MLGWLHLPRLIFYINHLLITLLTKNLQLCKPFCVCLVSQNSFLAIKQASLCRYIRVCQARFVFLLLADLLDMWTTQHWSEKVFSFSEPFWDEVKATVKLSFYSLSGNYITTLGHDKLLHQHTLTLFWQSKTMRMCAEFLQQLDSFNRNCKQWSEETWLNVFSQAILFRMLIQGWNNINFCLEGFKNSWNVRFTWLYKSIPDLATALSLAGEVTAVIKLHSKVPLLFIFCSSGAFNVHSSFKFWSRKTVSC